MKSEDIFHKLSNELTNIERQKILDDVLKSAEVKIISSEYHYTSREPLDIRDQESHLNFFQRIIIWFDCLLHGKDRDYVLKEHILAQTAKRLSVATGYITKDGLYLTAAFRKDIEELYNISLFFKNSIGPSIESKPSFYAFLGRIVLSDHHEALVATLNPKKIYQEMGLVETSELKKNIDKNFESLMDSLNSKDKAKMRESAAMLEMLQNLCIFEFQKLLSFFSIGIEASFCKATQAGRMMKKLSTILGNLDYTGGAPLFEALYLFVYFLDDRMEDVSNSDLEKWIKKAFEMIVRLQELVEKLNLRDLTACCLDDCLYSIPRVARGVDWFNLYHKFWTRYKNKKIRYFMAEKKFENQCLACAKELSLSSFPKLEYYGKQWILLTGRHPRLSDTLAWSSELAKWIEAKMSYTFKVILSEGQFYKKQNKEEFLKNFEIILGTPKRVEKIDERIKEYITSDHFHNEVLAKTDKRNNSFFGKNKLVIEPFNNNTQKKVDQIDGSIDSDDFSEVSGFTEQAMVDIRLGQFGKPDDPSVKNSSEGSGAKEKRKIDFGEVKSSYDINRMVDVTVKEFRDSLLILTHIIKGILYGQGGGRYDTLSNLAYLGGNYHDIFISKLKLYLDRLNSHYELLNILYDLENSLD